MAGAVAGLSSSRSVRGAGGALARIALGRRTRVTGGRARGGLAHRVDPSMSAFAPQRPSDHAALGSAVTGSVSSPPSHETQNRMLMMSTRGRSPKSWPVSSLEAGPRSAGSVASKSACGTNYRPIPSSVRPTLATSLDAPPSHFGPALPTPTWASYKDPRSTAPCTHPTQTHGRKPQAAGPLAASSERI